MANPDPAGRSAASPIADPVDRHRILSAAAQVFAARGYAATTFGRLGQAAQLDPLVFEAIFPDLQDCFLRAYDQVVCSAREALLGSFSPRATWPDRLAAALHALLSLIEAHPAEARLVFVEASLATPATGAHHLATLDRLTPFFRAGRETPAADPRVPPLVDSVLPGGIAFMLGFHLGTRPKQPVGDLYAEALRFLLLPYLGDEQTTTFVTAADQFVGSGECADGAL